MLRKIHRTSALVLFAFIALHLTNHLFALTGIEAHIAMMRQLRAGYRHPVAETAVLLAALSQVVTGLILVYRGRRERRTLWQRVQAWSGIVLAAFLLQHVPAVMVGRYLQKLDTNFYFAAAVLQGGVYKYYFLPYYFAGVAAVFVHLAAAVRLRLPYGCARTAVVFILIVTGIAAACVIVLCFGGAFYEIRLPAGYAFL